MTKIKPLSLLLLAFLFTSPAYAEAKYQAPAVGKKQLEDLVSTIKLSAKDDFKGFLKSASAYESMRSAKETIDKYLANQELSETESIYIYRLLGTYARIKYKDEILEVLSELVTYPTYKEGDRPQYKNPGIKKFGKKIKKLAKKYSLGFKNHKNRIFEVFLPQKRGVETVAMYTHGDTVPADPEKWVLPDGTKLDPFKATIRDGKIYGRGTEDDKCSIAAALVVLRTIQEVGLTTKRNIKLLIETTEETTSNGIKYYKKKNKLPDYNLVLDSAYPIVTAEKGTGKFFTFFPLVESADGNVIASVSGGTAINVIPKTSTIKIKTKEAAKLEAVAKTEAKKFIAANGKNFRITTKVDGDVLTIDVIGLPAHGMRPDWGLNPVSRAFCFLNAAKQALQLQDNHFTNAAKYVADNFGIDDYGRKLGVAFSDPFMGPMTAPVTYTEVTDTALKLGVNLRNPRGRDKDELEKEVADKLTAWGKKQNIDLSLDMKLKNFMYRDPSGAWITTLLDIFGTVTEKPSKARSNSGGTSAKYLPNGISFGPQMPGEVYMGHNPNEFKKVENFMLDIQMFTEAFLRLGNQEKMN